MFSSALKSFSSNITSNYKISDTPSAICGPWKIYDAKKRSGGKAVSVFIFERKSLEPASSGFGSSRSSSSSMKKFQDEVVERLRKEASSLARLRHPSILELAEPVEDTRSGGLMFATEPVSASLAILLDEKDAEESRSGAGSRRSRYVVEDPDSGERKRREVEIDELEIQKGLLQIGKGLEFLHESAGLVHANLTPEAIFVNAKSDWKLSGLGFSTPPANSSSTASTPTISLSEVLNHDPRLPQSVQLDLNYASPDFVLDNNISISADMFSLGLVIIALYHSPHKSPLDTGQSVSNYKRIFSSSANVPTANNNFLVTGTLPRDIKSEVLPKLITRRPAQRYGAREFQQAQYFDNILVSTIRFLDSLPAKSPNEKAQFLRGLPRILPQFPKSVLEKKVLPALLDETKDQDLLSLILQNVFKVLEQVSNSRRAFTERVLPSLRATFIPANEKKSKDRDQERDTRKEAGLLVVLENMAVITNNCSGKDFKDDVMPLIYMALESPTASIVDKALQGLTLVLGVLDFSTIKNELFPVVANVFSKTSSMAIKIRSLQSLGLLCGATADEAPEDLSGLANNAKSPSSSSAILDKYTIQEKVVPLLRAIKTKEPAVMMAALIVFKQVGKVCDSDFIAFNVLPVLWAFSLGPLLNLQQFQAYMGLIKSLSSRIESEQTRKLSELNSSTSRNSTTITMNNLNGSHPVTNETDFESLVTGRKPTASPDFSDGGWGSEIAARPARTPQAAEPAMFSWSTPINPPPAPAGRQSLAPATQGSAISRTVTPDNPLSSFAALTPANVPMATGLSDMAWGQPMKPSAPPPSQLNRQHSSTSGGTSIDWSSMGRAPASDTSWGRPNVMSISSPQQPPLQSGPGGFGATTKPMGQMHSPQLSNSFNSFNIAPPPRTTQVNATQSQFGAPAQQQSQKTGLDKYESLI